MSAKNIDDLLNIWAATLAPHNDPPPFQNHKDLYVAIDTMPHTDIPWEHFTLQYINPDDPVTPQSASWKHDKYDVWFHDPCKLIHDILANCDFAKEFDCAPYHEYETKNKHNHQYHNLMSDNWAWKEAVGTSCLMLQTDTDSSYRILFQKTHPLTVLC